MDTDTDTDKAYAPFTRITITLNYAEHGRIKVDLPASEDIRRRAICAFWLMNSQGFGELISSIQDRVESMSDAEVDKKIIEQYSLFKAQGYAIETAQ